MVDEYDIWTPGKVLIECFSIPRQTVCRHVRRAGVIRQPEPFTDDDIAPIVSDVRGVTRPRADRNTSFGQPDAVTSCPPD